MKIALCIFRFFAFGGLQKDFLRLATTCAARGHDVRAYCGNDSAPAELLRAKLNLKMLPLHGWTNHSRARSFEKQFAEIAAEENFDCVIGFNRMAGLDFYFAGDSCFAERIARADLREKIKFLLPRYRTFLRMEKSVFSPQAKTRILTISPNQQHDYIRRHQTPSSRFFRVPLDFDPRCRELAGDPARKAELRSRTREDLGVRSGEFALILVGSDFKRKGALRIINAVAALPSEFRAKTKIFLIGDSVAGPYLDAAAHAGLTNNVFALGGRKDVPALLCAADWMIHPAEDEAGGSVLLEAAVLGVPVICTEICGFAGEIERWEGGFVLTHPFRQQSLNLLLTRIAKRRFSEKNSDVPVNSDDWSGLPKENPAPLQLPQTLRHEAVADLIENFCENRRRSREKSADADEEGR